jgi:uncharacterized protein (TIGR01777 family)
MRVLVTGGTGFLGKPLCYELLRRGHEVLITTRRSVAELEPSPFRFVNWPVVTPIEENLILSCDAVINLAGESIAGQRWTDEKKDLIRSSRIQFTRELVDLLRRSTQLKNFISSSAIGFYGNRKTEVLTEDSPAGEGFLADVCKDWEQEALKFQSPDVRVALLRTGIVLGRESGALSELEPLYKNWAGGPVGGGEQMMSWIHREDWIHATIYVLENSKITGPVNLVAPEPVSNKSFSVLYAELFGQPVQVPTPAAALKLALGEMSSLVLDSQNVRPLKLTNNGFTFRFPYLDKALLDLYEYESQGRKVHELYTTSLWVPAPLEKVFPFFSDEKNLERLTPPLLNFHVEKKSTEKIMAGTLIDYKLKIHGVPTKWRTLIEIWDPPHRFVDTQTSGPYSRWHHTHLFEPLAGGVLMTDRVHYRLPMGPLGRTFGLWLVKKDMAEIFRYRQKIIKELFTAK